MSTLVDATIAMLRREVSTWRARAERAETELLAVKLQLARVTAERNGLRADVGLCRICGRPTGDFDSYCGACRYGSQQS